MYEYVWRNIETRSYNHCCRGKALSATYHECLCVALVIQHAKRKRLITLSSMASLTLQKFYHII